MSAKRALGNSEYLKKRIPQNPKYEHVKSRLDTGCSLTKYLDRLEEIKRTLPNMCNIESGTGLHFSQMWEYEDDDVQTAECQDPDYRYRRGELFKRLKVSTLAQLVIQVASVSDLNSNLTDEETPRLNDNDSVLPEMDANHLSEGTNGSPQTTPVQFIDNSNDCVDTGFSPRSTLQSVISGVGELDLDKCGQKGEDQTDVSTPRVTEQPYPDCPYLLLDVRDKEEYKHCHIISAYNYPIATLSRTMNPYTKEVLDFKNASGKIIIVYDEDERIATQAATTMCERGFENLFMLSGGLKVLAQKFPEGLTTGSIPGHCLPSPTVTGGRKRSTPRTVPQPAEKKWRFSPEDLSKIKLHLEEMLVPTNPNSRMSRMSLSSSKASSARSRHPPSAAMDSARAQSSRPWK